MPVKPSQSRKKPAGSILIAVLGLVALLSALLISFMHEAMERVKFNGLLDDSTDLRERAYSTLEVALASIAQIAEIDDGLRSTSQGWGDPLTYAGFEPYDDCTVQVTCEDEAAKLPLATMDEQQIVALLEELDITYSDADKLALNLLDWMDADDNARLNGMDGDDYERADIPCKPTNAVPRSWDEFLKIDGFSDYFLDKDGHTTELFDEFRDAVSLYNSGSVNVNDASELVWATLAGLGSGFDEDDVIRTLEGTDDVRGTMDDTILESSADISAEADIPLAQYSTQLLRLRVVASRGDAHFSIDALVKYNGAAKVSDTETDQTLRDGYEDFPDNPASTLSYPFRILHLTEMRNAP